MGSASIRSRKKQDMTSYMSVDAALVASLVAYLTLDFTTSEDTQNYWRAINAVIEAGPSDVNF